MIKLKSLLDSKWFFPSLIFYYGVFYILFGETYIRQWSADGRVFAGFVWDLKGSHYFDAYYVYRILPSVLVSFVLNLFSIFASREAIVTSFQILNLISLMFACYFFKKILILFKITLKNQLLSFTLLLLNFAVLKYPFYLPVMTDTVALMLSTALLYFYLKNNVTALVIITILLAFTWPMGYYQGLLLIAFPFSISPLVPLSGGQKKLLYGTSIFYILILSVYFIFIEKIDITVEHVARIDRNLLPLSILATLVLYFFFVKIFFNKTLFDVLLFFKKINHTRLLIACGVFAIVYVVVKTLGPNPIPTYSTAQTLRDPIVYALIKPFVAIVSHITYFGIGICLIILFWSSICKVLSQLGWGVVGAVGLNLFLFGITPQSRHLINLLPWVIIFLAKAINKFSFSNAFYITVGLLSLFVSKIWLSLSYEGYPPMQLDKNGSMGFPQQKLWLNIGPWMSEQMYFIQGGIELIVLGILFFMLYKVERNAANKLRIVPKYQLLK
jgi:hypothetical protein